MRTVELLKDEPLAVIGDIHGEAGRLADALGSAAVTGRRIVTLGDYIDRGSDSRLVLENLIALRASRPEGEVVLLRGNHEATLLDWLDERVTSGPFFANRGAATIRSYIDSPGPNVLEDFRLSFPTEHRDLLRSTALCAEGPEVLIAHGGYNVTHPEGRAESDLLGASPWRDLVAATNRPRRLVVAGHYTQASGAAYQSADLIGLDTGAGTIAGQPLSVLQLPERTIHAF